MGRVGSRVDGKRLKGILRTSGIDGSKDGGVKNEKEDEREGLECEGGGNVKESKSESEEKVETQRGAGEIRERKID